MGVGVLSGCESVNCGGVLVFASVCRFLCGRLVPLIGGRVGVFVCMRVLMALCCFDVVETSYEGHMVDALASRADEGRWSLR